MRNLQAKDIFAMSRLIMSLDLKDEFKKIVDKVDGKTDLNSIGYEMFFTVLGKCTDEKTENKVYEFLSGPLEIKVEEVAAMDIFDLSEKIMEVASIDKWKLFFNKASQLIR